ncbi:MAG: hypothetical protein ACK5V9_04135 [Burkholderiales bacterium]
MFLKTMKPKALAKWTQFPGLFDKEAMLNAKDLYEFDNVFTAPLHGFNNTQDYWARASAKPLMQAIQLPALAPNTCKDHFVTVSSLPQKEEVSRSVTLWQPLHGGHVGFAAGSWPGHIRQMPNKVGEWLMAAVGATSDKQGVTDG